MRELGYEGPIVGVTGNIQQQYIDEFIASGAVDAIPKPLEMLALQKVLIGAYVTLFVIHFFMVIAKYLLFRFGTLYWT